MRRLIRRFLHRAGLEVYRYPDGCERLEPHLLRVLRAHPPDLVLDVGANEGQFARSVRDLGYTGGLVSFEPIPPLATALAAAAAAQPHWHVRGEALGDADGSATLNVSKASDFSSLLAPNAECAHSFPDGAAVVDRVVVPVRRLDGLLDEVATAVGSPGHRVLLKMDTQGFDARVLAGALGCMDRIAIIVTELSAKPLYDGAERYLDTLTRLDTQGFELTGIFPVTRDERLAVYEFNCVLIRRGSQR